MSQCIQRTQKQPNPQGKGCVPVPQDWAVLCPQLPEQKSAGDLLGYYYLALSCLAMAGWPAPDAWAVLL